MYDFQRYTVQEIQLRGPSGTIASFGEWKGSKVIVFLDIVINIALANSSNVLILNKAVGVYTELNSPIFFPKFLT